MNYTTQTEFPPEEKPVLVWDGQCGFCKYCVIRMKKLTGERIDYAPYQKVADRFQDIDEKEFKKRVQFILPNGKVYSGPAGIYKALADCGQKTWLFRLYTKNSIFRKLSESGYRWIAKHRILSFKITRLLWGSDPLAPRTYWFWYVFATAFVLVILIVIRW